MNDLYIKQADLTRNDHAEIFVSLLNAYLGDPKGAMASDTARLDRSVADNLSRLPHAAVFFAKNKSHYVAMAVCFWGFSTFRNQPLLNIHDLIVLPPYRRQGIARALLRHIESVARTQNACKLTLEVREDNEAAATLYSTCGFADEKVPMRFRVKYL